MAASVVNELWYNMSHMEENKTKFSPEDFFLNLGAMASLYISAVALISLWWNYVNSMFPDAVYSYYDPYSSGVRWAMAALIIVFPIFVWLTRIINQRGRKDLQKREIKVRKWLVYLTLFVAGLTIVIDLVAILNNFLGGELSARFGLKALAVLIVAGIVFYYYLQDVRGQWISNEKMSVTLGWIVGLVVLASIVGGFFIAGSPMHQRQVRMDMERISDLENLQWQITEYWRLNRTLPVDLSVLEEEGYKIQGDPKTGGPYGYERTGDLTYELCATFETSNQEVSSAKSRGFVEPNYNWDHDEGEECFQRRINPNDYPLNRGIPEPTPF